MFLTKYTTKTPQFGWNREFDKVFEDFDNIFKPLEINPKKEIKVNVVDNKKDYTVEALLPGLDKDKISIEYNQNKLTITYKNSEEKEDKKYLRKEFKSEQFTRTVILPNDVDLEQASAEYKDGVLTLIAPKTKCKKQKIDIK